MNLYLAEGWINIPLIISWGMAFIFITGARGIGKTYGTLEYCVEEHIQFIYMRRTEAELKACTSEMLNPFIRLNADKGWNIRLYKEGNIYVISDSAQGDDGKWRPIGQPLGAALALSTFANIRGFDGPAFDLLFYDEFIPETRARKIRDEYQAFMNAYETINRNRELEGKPPLQCVCASNSNRLDNPLYLGLRLVSKAKKMATSGQEYSIIRDRSLAMVNGCASPVSIKKKETALYKLAGDDSFSAMALGNQFLGEDEASPEQSRPLREYKPLAVLGEICLYEHKSNGCIHISEHISGTPPTYGVGETEMARFRRAFGWVWLAYLNGNVTFENRLCEILLTKYFE